MIEEIKWRNQPDLSKYYTKETEELVNRFRAKRFRLKDTGITPYVYNQWKKLGLITVPFLEDNRKWVSISLSEWVWLKVINDLRRFGCSIQDILNIKNNVLFNPINLASKELKKVFEDSVYENLEKSKILTGQQIEEAKQSLKEMNLSLTDFLKQEAPQQTLFEGALLYVLVTGHDVDLVLYLDAYIKQEENKTSQKVLVKERHRRLSGITGHLYYPDFNKLDYKGNLNDFFSVPHMRIPLKTYFVEFITSQNVEKELEALNILSKEELVLLKEMRKDKVKRIVIHYSKDKIDRIEVTRPLQKAQEARLAETFLSYEHADIEYTVAKGQIVKFEKTTKIKP